jgi:uncharacterized protein YcgL (UPF0745 family)
MKEILTLKKKKFVNNEVEKYRQILEERSSYISTNTENNCILEKDSITDLENDLNLFLQDNI